jgi:hypothetical protein
VFEFGPIGAGLLGVGLFLFALSALGAAMCLLLRVPIRGPLLYDREQPPQALAFRLLAHFAVIGTACFVGAAASFSIGV